MRKDTPKSVQVSIGQTVGINEDCLVKRRKSGYSQFVQKRVNGMLNQNDLVEICCELVFLVTDNGERERSSGQLAIGNQ